ncbi:Trigger factor [Rhynchospora pubera]|uniref:peptidylprolyl isomerase n=1 Tax=Rhynchospora pubera TaxID=906938 RepID=A0AAV8DDN5_9POAL|nr:Trigger factor [Rhynchospora pubera]KAJ4764979.1 Trigger factor [Rhynchospora pubera]
MELSLRSSLSIRHVSFPILFSSSSRNTLPLPHLSNPTSFSPLLFSSSRRSVMVCASAVELKKTEKEYFPVSGIRVTESELPNSCLKLSVEVSPRICLQCYNSSLDEYSKHLKVHGFRPGQRLPENLIANYVGRENMQKAAIEAILKKTLPEAMSSVEGRAVRDSLRITSKLEDMSDSFSHSSVFRYDVVVDIAPTVTWLLDTKYKDLKIVVEIDDIIDAEKASEREFMRRHKALGALRIVTDRGLQLGDLVVLDIYGESIADGESKSEKIPNSERKGFHLDTEESSSLLPGFLEAIIGIRQGETRSFPLEFPQSWEQESLRGVSVNYTVECKELFYRELPPLDDSIAGQLVPGCTTLDQVKELILQRCREVERTAIDQATDNAILDRLGKIVEVDIPQSLFEEQGRELYGAKLLQLQAENRLNENQLQSLAREESVREYLQKERENISAIVRQMLAIGEIFKSENLQLSTEELVKEVEKSVAEFKNHNQDYDEDRVKEQVQDVLEGAKVLEWLRENARIEYVKK